MKKEDITKRIRLIHDEDYQWDVDCADIAYLDRSRYCLGTEGVSEERMDEIRDGIADGTLIGLPVYAYVHTGATISTTPYSCPWDSGRSGYVYMTADDAKGWSTTDDVIKALEGIVTSYDTYMQGECYYFVVEEEVSSTWVNKETGEEETRTEWNHLDSCSGFLGADPKENGIEDYVKEYLAQGFVYTDEEGDPL